MELRESDQGSEQAEGPIKPDSAYDWGLTPSVACRLDQRFSYCLYVPKVGDTKNMRILVAVHGTGRGNQTMRSFFTELADELNLIVLAPLFPCGIEEATDRDNYKYIEYRGIRFDLLLLDMVDDVIDRYGLSESKFSIIGFSGGAHFSHRFFYLHPERLSAVSACAPGSPTMPDESKEWWVGVADMEARFGRSFSIERMRNVPVHLAVGAADLETWEITHYPGSKHWMEGANELGKTRVERLGRLFEALRSLGIKAQLDIVPDITHEFGPLAEQANSFFRKSLGADD